jgi:hypothetical protein
MPAPAASAPAPTEAHRAQGLAPLGAPLPVTDQEAAWASDLGRLDLI